MGSSKKVASGVIWGTIYNIVNGIYGFVSVPILINYFGKAEYGLIGLAMSVNVYLRLMDLGFNSTNVRFFAAWLAKKDYDKTQKMFQTSLAFYGSVGLLNALILFAVSLFTQQLFHLDPDQDTILKNLLYVLMVSAIVSWYSSCFDQLIRATENVGWIQRRSFIPKLSQIAVLLLTVLAHLSIELYFLLTTFSMFLIIPLSVKKIRQETPFVSFLPKWNLPILKEILPYCLNIFSFSIFQFSFYNLRPVFLGMQGTIESVADFRVLNQVISLITLFAGSFMGALLPSASKIVATKNKEAYYKIAYDGTKYISIVICFCSFGMMTVGTDVIKMYVGDDYLNLIPWFYLWLLCILGDHNRAISSLLLAGNDIRVIAYMSAAACFVGLPVSWFLIPHYQVGGVVLGFCAYMLIQMLFYYIYYYPRKMKIDSRRVLLHSLLPYVACGVALFLIINQVLAFHYPPLWNFLLKGTLFAVVYGAFALAISTKTDRAYIRSLIKRK